MCITKYLFTFLGIYQIIYMHNISLGTMLLKRMSCFFFTIDSIPRKY